MMQYTPGSFVHYRQLGSQESHWPAVVCTDDVAPESFLQTRPQGGYIYLTVVLLMGENLQFRWARTTEMSNYDPFVPFEEDAKVACTPGLGDAYEMANNALEADLGLDYWREQIRTPITVVSDSEDTQADSEEEGCSDLEMKKALRASRKEYYGKRSTKASGKRRATLPTPSLSPRERRYKSNGRSSSTGTSGTHTGSLFRPSAAASSSSAPNPSGYFRQREDPRSPSSPQEHRLPFRGAHNIVDLTEESNATTPTDQNGAKSRPFQLSSFLDRTLGNLDRSLVTPTSDTIDGELDESKEFVQAYVGPDGDVNVLQMKSVWNRPYFRGHGLNYFDRNDEGIWELNHPNLPEIQPEDFVFVAEYLESEEFGHRYPRDRKEIAEAYAQCVAAWSAARSLGMSDLMDHIIVKLKQLDEPGLTETLAFAIEIYDSPDTELLSYHDLKDYLATYIAQHWWVYVEDDHLSAVFIDTLKKLPELERDIYARRIAALDERLDDDTEMN